MRKRFEFYNGLLHLSRKEHEDIEKLRKFISDVLDIEMSYTDTYLLWQAVSNDNNSRWLDIEPYLKDKYELLGKIKGYGRLWDA